MDPYEALKIENQVCFPLYACSKEVVRSYKPYLDPLDLTYTQYITMMVLWEYGKMNVKELGARLYLDSGTLTPVLKKLENKGYIYRERSATDERSVNVAPTKEGMLLRDQAISVPASLGSCIDLSAEELTCLHRLLYKLLGQIKPTQSPSVKEKTCTVLQKG